MKLFVFAFLTCSLFVFIGANKRDVFRVQLAEQTKKCKFQTHATEADVQNMYYYIPATTREGKCMEACLMQVFNVIDNTGRINTDVFWKFTVDLSQGNYRELWEGGQVINSCKNLPIPSDPCESSQIYVNCMKSEARRRGIEFVYIWGPEPFLKLFPLTKNLLHPLIAMINYKR